MVKAFIITVLIASTFASASPACQLNKDSTGLVLAPRDCRIDNSIDLLLSEEDVMNLKITDGTKFTLTDPVSIINGDTIQSDEINTRGGSTLRFIRKSLSFSLKTEAVIRHGDRTEKLKKFYAQSLSMDKDYCSNRLAYEMMEKIDIMHLFYAFGKVSVNGKCEGICMVMERPEDWAIKKMNSPCIIRRGYYETIDKISLNKVSGEKDAGRYEDYFRNIYKAIRKYEGEELYRILSGWIDLDNYMEWIAFNYLIKNGDYTDEVFFYVDTATNRFRIIPWDYDDIFFLAPHEGAKKSRKARGNKLVFSSEDKLDLKIATDPYLYNIYLGHLRKILDVLTEETLREVFENTYAELYPYYSENELIKMSRYDSHNETNLEIMSDDLRKLYNQLVQVFRIYRDYLKNPG
jgi:spore coat protein H